MAVVGVGIDLVNVPEFAKQLRQPGSTFPRRFSVGERRDAESGVEPAERRLAARWAAREAVIKAWSGSRFARTPVLPESAVNDIEVVTDNWGRPKVTLHGDIAQAMAGLRIQVSLTHDGDIAAAVAILESDQP